jgi:hypothetical protein
MRGQARRIFLPSRPHLAAAIFSPAGRRSKPHALAPSSSLCPQAQETLIKESGLTPPDGVSIDTYRLLLRPFCHGATVLYLGPGRDVELHLAAREIGAAIDLQTGCLAELEHDTAISAFAIVGIRQSGDQGHG